LNAEQILIEGVGWAGAGLVLIAYGLLSAGKLKSGGPIYQAMNITGAAGLMANAAWYHAWPSTAVNLIWGAIGGVALWRIVTGRSSTSAM
jgi:hypothetical protein